MLGPLWTFILSFLFKLSSCLWSCWKFKLIAYIGAWSINIVLADLHNWLVLFGDFAISEKPLNKLPVKYLERLDRSYIYIHSNYIYPYSVGWFVVIINYIDVTSLHRGIESVVTGCMQPCRTGRDRPIWAFHHTSCTHVRHWMQYEICDKAAAILSMKVSHAVCQVYQRLNPAAPSTIQHITTHQ